ncbi:MAG: translation initiation factor IF-2 [Phycisphaeraceae bacterium]
MAKAKRVHQVAKELGVDSKAIVAKCQAEEVPGIVNHMSTVKLGLEATIKEWFSEESVAQTHTAVETSDKVDLTKARKVRRRRSVAKKEDEIAEAAAGTATATVEPPAEPTADQVIAASSVAVVTGADAEAITKPAQKKKVASRKTAAAAKAPAVEQPPAETQADAATRTRPIGKPNVPDRPPVVEPAGERLDKPKDAVLKGPKVVRIEEPDKLGPPRPRPRRARPEAEGPLPPPPLGTVPGVTRSRGPVRGRGAGPAVSDAEPGARPPSKRRMLNTRRGRSADALPTGPTKFSEQDLLELDARLKGAPGFLKQRRRDMRKRETTGGPAVTPAVIGGTVEVSEPIFIKDLSSATGIKAVDIIKYLFKKGIMAMINSAIDAEAAMEVCLEYNIELEVREQQTAAEQVVQEFEQREQIDVRPRPPVVTVLGHVDHGKTSLLDRIRKADVAAHEAGGITQHVGAYRVTIPGHNAEDKTVVFLDTPGHEAFTSMRARGAHMTDLVVLVVAADDGVMPQTVESINHAKAAEVPLIVALNKIDKPEATEEKIRQIYGQLAEHGLNPVEWGGQTEAVKTSAETGDGITELLELLDYQAELLELQADYAGAARGAVIESEMQEGRGPVARVLVQQGTLKVSDFIVIGRAFGRVRDMTDDRDRSIRQAGPATPVELSGIDVIPDAGDKFFVTDTLHKAEQVASQYRETERQQQLASQTKVRLDTFAQTLATGGPKELRVVLKADVHGSIDVLRKSLTDVGNDEVLVKVLHAAVGGITESDVLLADASDAVIIGFHVVAPTVVRDIADQRRVDIRLYRVIYDVIDNVKKALEGMLEPELKQEQVGVAEVREVFRISKVGAVAGCLVTEGLIQRKAKVRVARDGVVVTDDRNVESLRRVKEDVREVRAGLECGIRIAGFDDLKPGDTLECYNTVTVARTLE